MKKILPFVLMALVGLGGCSSERVSNFPSYKLKVIQGNEPDAQALMQLRPGMSRNQVQLLIGTPLLQDPFHAGRWDYVYDVSRNGVIDKTQSRNLTLWFDGDTLVKMEGTALPAVQNAAGAEK